MPIPKSNVKGETIEEFKHRLLAFLKKDHTQAYTLAEIAKAVANVAPPFTDNYALVVLVLEELLANKEVSGKIDGSQVYFWIRDQ